VLEASLNVLSPHDAFRFQKTSVKNVEYLEATDRQCQMM
jgi:hypothetical protein